MNGFEVVAAIFQRGPVRWPVYTDEGEVQSVRVENGVFILSTATEATEDTDTQGGPH